MCRGQKSGPRISGLPNQKAEGVDRIARIRHQNHIARLRDRLGHVGKAFLGAQRRHHLGVRIELHPKPAAVIGGLRLAQPRNALGRGIAVGARVLHRFLELIDDVLGGRQIGIAHAEIDDVHPGGAGLGLDRIDVFKHVRRQASDAVKIFVHGFLAGPVRGPS